MNKIISFLLARNNNEHLALDMTSTGLSTGIIGLIVIVVYSALAYGTGYGIEIETFIESLLPGYTLTLGGVIVGAIWVFSLGYMIGYLYAWIYNKLIKKA